MSIVSFNEATKIVSRPRRERITPAQFTRRRNAHMLAFLEGHGPDPETGRYRAYTVREIAELFGVSPRAVQLGIAGAREVRERVHA